MAVRKWRILDGDAYVNSDGDSTLGDGSMDNPYQSIQRAFLNTIANDKIVVGSAHLRQLANRTFTDRVIVGDGEPVYYRDASFYLRITSNVFFRNIVFKDIRLQYVSGNLTNTWSDLRIINTSENLEFSKFSGTSSRTKWNNSVFRAPNFEMVFNTTAQINYDANSTTFYANNDLHIYVRFANTAGTDYINNRCIYSANTYTFDGGNLDSNATYFKQMNRCCFDKRGVITFNGQSFDLSTGTIEQLRTLMASFYGGVASEYLPNCIIADPLWNDITNNDFSLRFDSPCIVDETTYIGGLPPRIKFYADADNVPYQNDVASFYLPSIVGLDLNQDDTNRALHFFSSTGVSVQSAETKPWTFGGKIKHFAKNETQKLIDLSLREIIDVNKALADTPTASGGIIEDSPYYVKDGDGTVTYNGNTFGDGQPNRYFTGVTGVTTYTGTAQPYEIVESPNRVSVGIRSSYGDTIKLAGESLAANTWYMVDDFISATYNGLTVTHAKTFITDGSGGTHAGGKVRELWANSATYVPLEQNWYDGAGVQNADGSLVRANGGQDADYINDIFINGRAFQIKIVVEEDNSY